MEMQFSEEDVFSVLERTVFWMCTQCARSGAVMYKEGEDQEQTLASAKQAHDAENILECNPCIAQPWEMRRIAGTVLRELRRKQLPEIVIGDALKGVLDQERFEDYWGQYYKDWARLVLYPLAMNCEGLTNPVFSRGQLVLLIKELRGDDEGPYVIRASVGAIGNNKIFSVSDVYVEWKRGKANEEGYVPSQYRMKMSSSCDARVCEAILAQLPVHYRVLLA